MSFPTSLPTQKATIAFPPSFDLQTQDKNEYNENIHGRIELIAIIGSSLGLIFLISMTIHYLLKMNLIDYRNQDWRLRHRTLAELEEQNLIMELEATAALMKLYAEDEDHFDQGDQILGHESGLQDHNYGEESIRDNDPHLGSNVVIGTQVNTL